MSNATHQIREIAHKLLAEGTVKVVIGYTSVGDGRRAPVFITKPEDCYRLVFDESCYVNLTSYLLKPEVKALGRPAIVSKGCDNRSINLLLAEKKLKREDLTIIGAECPGMDKTVCTWCDHHKPINFDHLVPADHAPEGLEAPADNSQSVLSAAAEIHNPQSSQQSWDYWMGEFSRCIRCYACRSVCPTCYCPQCLAEKNQPQGVDGTPVTRGNLAWQLIRAFHHAGRCVECGECERACPMDIPLLKFRSSMQDLIRERFACEPGENPAAIGPLAQYSEGDKEDFFR